MDRICKRCGELKNYSEFPKNKPSKDGILNICKTCTAKSIKLYKLNNSEKVKKAKIEINKRYNDSHREQKNAHNKEYTNNIKHTEEYKKKHSKWNVEYDKKRKGEDPAYKLKLAIRTRISMFLKDKKVGSSIKSLGCTLEELVVYMESKFSEGMNWDNYGKMGWHIDHIIPLSSFDLTNEKEFNKACHYTNLQPLWWYDNLRKGNKIISDII